MTTATYHDREELENWAFVRETSVEIARAFHFHAGDEDEAHELWESDPADWDEAFAVAFRETATNNGQHDATELHWGETNLAAALA